MSYKPNTNDPRVIKKIKKALGFVGSHLSDTKSHPWSTRYMDKYFGQQQHDLSKWLRNQLVICTNSRYSKDSGICKEYIKNKTGYDKLVSLIQITTTYPSVSQVGSLEVDFVKNEYKDELTTLDFTYNDKSGRLWHPLQRVRKEHKLIVFNDSGLRYQYDIQCCAPTLIHQHSQMLVNPMDLHLFALHRYFTNRNQIRKELAQEAEITEDLAKVIINALLTGAQLGNNQDSDIYKLLNGDKARIEYLKQNEYIKQLRSDIKTCWDYIKPTLSKRTIVTKTGTTRTLPISSKQKASLYFQLERQVLDSVLSYLNKTNNKHFLEHDGWACSNEIDRDELIKWVKNKTGFDIQLDLHDLTTTYPSV